MWEAIRENKTNSVILLMVLAVVLAGLGAVIGLYFAGASSIDGLFFGIAIAMVIWIIMLLTSFFGGEQILLRTAGAREVQHSEAPQLFNIVEEMQIASGLSALPKVYIIDTPEPNAFAVGRSPERAAVAVTSGLMAKLNRDELQGVVAHEVGHIVNRDTLFMTIVGVTVGAVVIISDMFLRGLWYSSRSRRNLSRDNGKMGAIIMVVSILAAILAPLLAQIMYFACSRKREYLADASAAKFTRYPEGLASALQKISGYQGDNVETSRTHAPMYIVNPLAAKGKTGGLFSTHPSVEDRIRILRGMGGDASFAQYEEAYKSLHPGEKMIDNRTLVESEPTETREASAESTKASEKKKWRDVQNILQQGEGYGMLMCMCGLNMKVPRNFEDETIECPKCGRENRVPAEFLAAAAALEQSKTIHQ
ncbi:MAG: Protease HtpX [Candidatus Marinimicrobia bacterium]|nr:Protease HtpX [Candidatus Neomarinimicrobiota bacterium]